MLVLYQRRFELEASGGEKVKLLIAVKRVERGKPITEDAIAVREIPQAYVDDRAIRESEKNKIIGLKVGTAVKEQQLLLWSDLTNNDDRKDLSALVLPGYRAVSIKAARDDTSIALIKPGDYVDVIGVLGSSSTVGEAKNAVVLLQRILVLATGTDTTPESATERRKRIRTSKRTCSRCRSRSPRRRSSRWRPSVVASPSPFVTRTIRRARAASSISTSIRSSTRKSA